MSEKIKTQAYIWIPPSVVDFHIAWQHENDLSGKPDRKLYVDHDKGIGQDWFLNYRELMRLAGFSPVYYWAQDREIHSEWKKDTKVVFNKVSYTYDGNKITKKKT